MCAVATDKSQLYWCVCCVIPWQFRGAQDKQCEVGYKVGPSHTLLSIGRFPLAGPVVRATGVRSQLHSNRGVFRAVWSMSVFVP